jgi:hypothetical protein
MAGYLACIFKITVFVVSFFCFSAVCVAQNKHDIFIKDEVQPLLNAQEITDAEYKQLKAAIIKLERQYGYETNLKKRLLETAYIHKDIDFFKAELSILVKEHGFDVAYMRETESYYPAIMKDELAAWFKPMYLKNHTEWLSNNFDKQIELRKLNGIHEKDQALTAFAMRVLNVQGLDNVQQEAIKKLLGEYHLKNFEPVLDIAQKRKIFPNEKNFSVLENGYDTTLIHNFQFQRNLDIVWDKLFPYIKKAYAQNEITDVIFRNYDFYHYQHYGSQVFDSYTYDKMLEQFRQKQNPIPIKDKVWLDAFKKEFGWAD